MPVVMTAPGLLTAMILISFLSCRVLLEPRSEDAGQRFHVAGAGLDRWNDALPCKSVCGRRIHPEKMPARGWDATRRRQGLRQFILSVHCSSSLHIPVAA